MSFNVNESALANWEGRSLCQACGITELGAVDVLGEKVQETFTLDLSWLPDNERSKVSADFDRHYKLLSLPNGALWILRNSSFAKLYDVQVEGERLIFAPKAQPLKVNLLAVAQRRRQRVELRYGDSLRRRVTLVHRIAPWGFVGLDHRGYRNFKSERIHNLKLEDPRFRHEVGVMSVTIGGVDNLCASCSLKLKPLEGVLGDTYGS